MRFDDLDEYEIKFEGGMPKLFFNNRFKFKADGFGLDEEEHDGVYCEIETNSRDYKTWVEVIIIGNERFVRSRGNSRKKVNQGQSNPNNKKQRLETGTAPFNFVSLPQKVFNPSVIEPAFDKFENLSGFIEIDFECLTHFFTAGQSKDNGVLDFYKINNKAAIPGASIRGAIRTIIEIMSNGKLNTKFDKNDFLSFRSVGAQKSNLGFLSFDDSSKQYILRKGIDQEGTPIKNEAGSPFTANISAGKIAIRSGFMRGKLDKRYDYDIDESANAIKLHPNNSYALKFYLRDRNRKVKGDMRNILDWAKKESKNSSSIYKHGVPVFYTLKNNEVYSIGHSRNHRTPYKFLDKLPREFLDPSCTDFTDLLFGKDKGLIAGRVFFEDAIVSNEVESETEILEILAQPRITAEGIYMEKSSDSDFSVENRRVRGHKIYWHKNADLSKNNIIKIGNDLINLCWRKKLFRIQKDSNKSALEIDKILQRNDINNALTENEFLKHEVKSSHLIEIKKSKFSDLSAGIQKKFLEGVKRNSKLQFKIAEVIKPGAKFTSRIRFENITKEELGALLYAVNLTKDCAHKLGMGKPLGLGSVKLNVKSLKLIDRKERYKFVFDSDSWNEAITEVKELDSYQKAFSRLMNKEIETNGDIEFWDMPRMKMLKHILNILPLSYHEEVNLKWLKETRYQTLNEFKEKRILKAVLDVKV